MPSEQFQVCQVLAGPLFSEPMRVETVAANGEAAWVLGLVGTRTERFCRVTLNASDVASLHVPDARASLEADGALLRVGMQAYSLSIAHEFDLCFGLSISKVDLLTRPKRVCKHEPPKGPRSEEAPK